VGLLIIQIYLSAQCVRFCPGLDILIEDNEEAKGAWQLLSLMKPQRKFLMSFDSMHDTQDTGI